MDSLWPKAVAKISSEVELPGFRKGKAPEHIIVGKVGEMPILEEAGEMALAAHYADILIAHKIDAIGRPAVQITKIAKGSPLGFKIITAIVPTVTIKDYKKETEKVASEKTEIKATDEDVEKVLTDIQNNRKQIEKSKAQKEAPEGTTVKDEDIIVPEIDDAFVQSLGDFKDIADFKAKIKENIATEKAREAKDKKRAAVLDILLEKATVDVPQIMIDAELEKMMEQFTDDIKKAGYSMEDYLKQVAKTVDDIKKEWTESAEKRVKVQLILNHLADVEKVSPNEDDIKKEVDHLVSHYKDADRTRARLYVESVLKNEMVLRKILGEKEETVSLHDHDHSHDEKKQEKTEDTKADTETK